MTLLFSFQSTDLAQHIVSLGLVHSITNLDIKMVDYSQNILPNVALKSNINMLYFILLPKNHATVSNIEG